jgi:hypothetical protein
VEARLLELKVFSQPEENGRHRSRAKEKLRVQCKPEEAQREAAALRERVNELAEEAASLQKSTAGRA